MQTRILHFCLLFITASLVAGTNFEILRSWHRLSAQPIISPREDGWESAGTFNPSVVMHGGKFVMLFRAQDRNGTSRLGYVPADRDEYPGTGHDLRSRGWLVSRTASPAVFPAQSGAKTIFDGAGGCRAGPAGKDAVKLSVLRDRVRSRQGERCLTKKEPAIWLNGRIGALAAALLNTDRDRRTGEGLRRVHRHRTSVANG